MRVKFRGIAVATGAMIYGDLIHYPSGKLAIWNFAEEHAAQVYEDTVAQLVGVDSEGKDVYEGDEIISDDGHIVYAAMQTFARHKPTDEKTRKINFSYFAKSGHWRLKDA